MSPLNALIFGLGLFFLGLRLVSENLSGLAGGSLREGIARTTRRPLLRVGLGLSAGALMQSATAVTFICVSMAAAELLTLSAAATIIVWCNVGLTALAFLATLDIHPVVAFVVGGSGIILGVVRIRTWQTIAGVLLGMGLILLGLQQMGEGAAPLKDSAWFKSGIDLAVSSPPLAFFAGTLAAAILQSNTGATMMVIALAGAGAIPFESAALLIYGTNLGAIALRLILASGMKGNGLRLVRLEDFFCVLSGALMMLLYAIELTGIPLVFALTRAITDSTTLGLAILFLLSNLVPALAITPLQHPVQQLLLKWFPSEEIPAAGKPQFLTPQAMTHPSTALDLVRKELAHLLDLTCQLPSAPNPNNVNPEPPREFSDLAMAIEQFSIKLAARPGLNEKELESLHCLRAALSAIRHFEEASRFYAARAAVPGAIAMDAKTQLDKTLQSLVSEAARALNSMDLKFIEDLAQKSKKQSPFLHNLQSKIFPETDQALTLDTSALLEDVRLMIWTFHHLMQILKKLPPAPQTS